VSRRSARDGVEREGQTEATPSEISLWDGAVRPTAEFLSRGPGSSSMRGLAGPVAGAK
jgi:hypothetical protein